METCEGDNSLTRQRASKDYIPSTVRRDCGRVHKGQCGCACPASSSRSRWDSGRVFWVISSMSTMFSKILFLFFGIDYYRGMTTVKAYCPGCDSVHSLRKTHESHYICPFESSFVLLPWGYYGCRATCRWNVCECSYGEYVKFSEVPLVCEKCKLPREICDFDRFVGNFTAQIWRIVRDATKEDIATAQCLAFTLKQRFQEIAAESKAANASALAPYLSSVLVDIVDSYIGKSCELPRQVIPY